MSTVRALTPGVRPLLCDAILANFFLHYGGGPHSLDSLSIELSSESAY